MRKFHPMAYFDHNSAWHRLRTLKSFSVTRRLLTGIFGIAGSIFTAKAICGWVKFVISKSHFIEQAINLAKDWYSDVVSGDASTVEVVLLAVITSIVLIMTLAALSRWWQSRMHDRQDER